MNRRLFLKSGGLALFSVGLDPMFLTRAAYARDRPSSPNPKTLICIFQRGAVDGLSMIAPHGESAYHRVRPAIGLASPGHPGAVLDLDGFFGLHPAMAPLLPYYRDGSLGIVHAVGSPVSTRSHFDAQDYLESGTPGLKKTADGWLNRQLAHTSDHTDTPFRGVAMGVQLPRALRGVAPSLAISDLRTFGVGGRAGRTNDAITSAFAELYRGSATGLVASSSEEGFEAVAMLRSSNPSAINPSHGAEYPNSRFGRAMRQLAQLIHADLGLEIGFADVGGWDTHFNQGAAEGQLSNRLGDFASGLAAFAADLGPRMADVMVLTMSEFGRTVRQNGSRGTDHGRATAMMVLGGGTVGGVHGRWPGLEEDQLADGRDLAVTTDFRDLFSEVLTRHLGHTDLNAVFPGYQADAARWVGAVRS